MSHSIGRWARMGALGTLVALAACAKPGGSLPVVDPAIAPAGGGGGGGGGGGQAADLPAGTAPIQAVAVPGPAGTPLATPAPTFVTSPAVSLAPLASPSGFFRSPTPIPALTPLAPPSLPPWWRGLQPDGVCPPDVLGDVDCPPGSAQRPR